MQRPRRSSCVDFPVASRPSSTTKVPVCAVSILSVLLKPLVPEVDTHLAPPGADGLASTGEKRAP